MQEPSQIRAVSFVLAVSVVVAGWFLFEYSNQPPPLISIPSNSSSEVPSATKELPSAPNQPTEISEPLSRHLSVTYKCEKVGRISYSDKPCASNERVVAIRTEEKGPLTKNNLEQIRERAAVWNASRIEQRKELPVLETKHTTTISSQLKELRCQQIDREITGIDAQLRQPHSGQWGDKLNGDRKELFHERFSLGC